MARNSGTVTLTSKGQMTLPSDVRKAFGLDTGAQLDVAVEREKGRIILTPRRVLHIDDICSRLPKPECTLSAAQMEDVIAEASGR